MPEIKILIAEDEAVVALDLRLQLQAEGYSVVAVARSGESAVEQAAQTHPDLIMMDIHLRGEMDGIEASRAIVTHLGIPVIFVSALVDKQTLDRASTVNYAGYVVKPFEKEKMLAAIRAALSPVENGSETDKA